LSARTPRTARAHVTQLVCAAAVPSPARALAPSSRAPRSICPLAGSACRCGYPPHRAAHPRCAALWSCTPVRRTLARHTETTHTHPRRLFCAPPPRTPCRPPEAHSCIRRRPSPLGYERTPLRRAPAHRAQDTPRGDPRRRRWRRSPRLLGPASSQAPSRAPTTSGPCTRCAKRGAGRGACVFLRVRIRARRAEHKGEAQHARPGRCAGRGRVLPFVVETARVRVAAGELPRRTTAGERSVENGGRRPEPCRRAAPRWTAA
ncbi:hypothetical protein HYPSUDRAFT_220701, partial [Hypholoma sublateritium FD-334 SS-4]